MSEESKPFYQSQTLIGIAIVCLPNILRLADSWFGTKLDNPNIDTICTTIGAFLGINGRVNANTSLKLK